MPGWRSRRSPRGIRAIGTALTPAASTRRRRSRAPFGSSSPRPGIRACRRRRAKSLPRRRRSARGRGAQVVEDTTGLDTSVAVWATIATAEARYSEAAQFEHHRALLGEGAAGFIGHGARVTRQHYVGAQMAREPIHRAYADLFDRAGASVLLTPTLGLEAFPHGSTHPEKIGGTPIEPPWLDWCGLLYDANLAGLPACAVPIGLGDDSLPVSLQVLGPRRSDGAVLAAAEAVERLVDFTARPGIRSIP
jgi:Asp-tRNA(Asn)/Glu-tRNA(Gln) amidotransferase A subunit family amidase